LICFFFLLCIEFSWIAPRPKGVAFVVMLSWKGWRMMNPYSLEEAKRILETSLREAREVVAFVVANIEKPMASKDLRDFKEVITTRIGFVAEGKDFIGDLKKGNPSDRDFDDIELGYTDALRQLQKLHEKANQK